MKGETLKLETPFGDAVSKVRFAPKSNNLLVSSWDSTLRLYDVDRDVVRVESRMEVAVLGCCFKDEDCGISVGADCCVRRHDFDSGMCSILGNHENLATCVEYAEETNQTITAGLDKQVISWDMHTNSGTRSLKNVGGEVESMSLSGYQLLIAIGASLSKYDLRKLEAPIYKDKSLGCVRFFPSYEGYAVGSIDGRVSLEFLNPCTANENRCQFLCHPKKKDGKHHLVSVNDLVFHPSRHDIMVSGDNDGFEIVWNAYSKKRLFQFPRYPSSVASISFNHDGDLLATASSFTYQEANEMESPPQIFIHQMDEGQLASWTGGSVK